MDRLPDRSAITVLCCA